ncbi:MAG: LytR C-terminal domain-containing protein [Candidatus Moranbacteria bacterium]|nr:LytR C-terminal domain-containing protein [Candidatus Moranbacteria bacterium]
MSNPEDFLKPKRVRSKKSIEEEKKSETDIGKSINLIKKIGSLIMVVVFLGLLGTSVYFYLKYRKAVANPNVAIQDEVKDISEKIGKFMELPAEIPTVATVSDKEKLQGQAFFANAQNGDRVLIYSKSQKAILWRPTTNKVIEVASLGGNKVENISAPATSQSTPANQENNTSAAPIETSAEAPAPTAPEKTSSAKVVVYNGTKIAGLAGKLGAQISAGVTGVEIVKTGNAAGNYSKTIVVDLTGNNTELVQKIIAIVGGEAGTLPDGEMKPDGDILVIGGGEK